MAPRVELRRLEDEDRDRIFAWRNSPDVRAYMYTDHLITPQEHAAWFVGIEGDESRRYWIVTSDDTPVGLVNLYDIDRANQRCAWAYYPRRPRRARPGSGLLCRVLGAGIRVRGAEACQAVVRGAGLQRAGLEAA
ncbi:MAG: UDP-4-amino-4,6-dideoxy-N-acetyl-beta-L-altrosamine N-acetyltransferase [Caulobacteraceae bacterium]